MLQTTVIYGITFFISLVFCKIYEKKENNFSTAKKILIIMAIIIPPVLLASLRYIVGIDYISYVINYNGIITQFSPGLIIHYYSKEPLYVVITYLGYLLLGNFTGAFYIYSIIYMLFVFEGIRYYNKKMSTTLGLFIFYMTYYLIFFNMVRQMLAVAIILFASRYIFEKKFWKYLVWVIIAGLIHKSAYVMILLYVLNFKLDSKKACKWFYILAIIAPIFMIPLFKIIIWINSLLGIFAKYSSIEINFSFKFLLYVLPTLLFIIFYRKRLLKIDERYELFVRIVFLQLPAQFMGCFIDTADRMSVYFGIFQSILIPLILQTEAESNMEIINMSNKKLKMFFEKIRSFTYGILNNRKWQKTIIISWYLFYYVVIFIVMNSNGVYPFRSIYSMKEFPIDLIMR